MTDRFNSGSNRNLYEKFLYERDKAKYHLKIADHMIDVSFILLKDKRLLIKILNELAKSSQHAIKAVLYKENILEKIQLYKDPSLNLNTFKQKIAQKYLSQEDTENIIRILEISFKHKNSPLEFVRNDKFVIMINDEYVILTIDILKTLTNSLKNLVLKI